jgi:hypothetical protein
MVKRLLQNLLSGPWKIRKFFPTPDLDAIEAAIKVSESQHNAQIRFAVEHGLNIFQIMHGVTPRMRAAELFSELGVWNTEHNSGVLVYVLLAERDFEIIADRGVSAHISHEEWARISAIVEDSFRTGRFREGVVSGISEITKHLVRLYPINSDNPNELSDRPVTL